MIIVKKGQFSKLIFTLFLSFLNNGFRYDSVCLWVAPANFAYLQTK